MGTRIAKLTLVFDVRRDFDRPMDVTVEVENPDPDSPLMLAALAAWSEDYQKRLDAMRAAGEANIGLM